MAEVRDALVESASSNRAVRKDIPNAGYFHVDQDPRQTTQALIHALESESEGLPLISSLSIPITRHLTGPCGCVQIAESTDRWVMIRVGAIATAFADLEECIAPTRGQYARFLQDVQRKPLQLHVGVTSDAVAASIDDHV